MQKKFIPVHTWGVPHAKDPQKTRFFGSNHDISTQKSTKTYPKVISCITNIVDKIKRYQNTEKFSPT